MTNKHTPEQIAKKLTRHNEWRRGNEDMPLMSQKGLGIAIDGAIVFLNNHEALKAKAELFDEAIKLANGNVTGCGTCNAIKELAKQLKGGV